MTKTDPLSRPPFQTENIPLAITEMAFIALQVTTVFLGSFFKKQVASGFQSPSGITHVGDWLPVIFSQPNLNPNVRTRGCHSELLKGKAGQRLKYYLLFTADL